MKENDQLDAVDRRLVRELQRDASLSHAALAERVGASAASVWRRVRNLEKTGVLGKAVRLADPKFLDRSVNVLCQVRMTRQTISARAEFEEFIQSREEIVECYFKIIQTGISVVYFTCRRAKLDAAFATEGCASTPRMMKRS